MADQCQFPGCDQPAEKLDARGMCHHHRRVTVSGSWVNDRHSEGGHG